MTDETSSHACLVDFAHVESPGYGWTIKTLYDEYEADLSDVSDGRPLAGPFTERAAEKVPVLVPGQRRAGYMLSAQTPSLEEDLVGR